MAVKKISVTLGSPQQKKNVVRFDADESEENPAMRTAYISKSVISDLGNPEEIKLTIEAA